MNMQSVAVDCESWTWEELNAWAEPIAVELECIEFNEMVRTNNCFKRWFHEWLEREKAAGNLTLVETITFYADEHTTGPHCGVVDEGNANCFSGDFEKLDAWVQKIIDRGNEKEIINKSNHNPCMRLWMKEVGLLNEGQFNRTILIRQTGTYTSNICLSGCSYCGYDYEMIVYDDGTYSYYTTYECITKTEGP